MVVNPFCTFCRKMLYGKETISLQTKHSVPLLEIKQRQLVALRQIPQKSQIVHQVTDRLADLGTVSEILSR